MTVEMTDEQLAAAEAWVEATAAAAGNAMLQLVELLIRGGEKPAAAVRLAGSALLIDRFGPGVLEELGVPQRTAMETRARLRLANRAAAASAEPDGSPSGSVRERWANAKRDAEHLLS